MVRIERCKAGSSGRQKRYLKTPFVMAIMGGDAAQALDSPQRSDQEGRSDHPSTMAETEQPACRPTRRLFRLLPV